jgi:acyl-CoA synthetase (AMP-forming)/AMP-acid ligase II
MIDLAGMAQGFAWRNPSAPALIDPTSGLTRTFGQLHDRCGQLAGALIQTYGLRPGGRVAALSRNNVELVELYLACAAAGVMLFPLNWRFSSSQILDALQAAGPTVVFYDSEFAEIIAEVRGNLDVADWVEWQPGADSAYEDLLSRIGHANGLVLPDSTTLADMPYLAISTGGTTGTAKSAVHTQRSYAACALDYAAAARIGDDDIYLMLGQLFHVVGYMTLAYLAYGRPVVMANFEAESTLDIVRAENVTAFMAIGAMMPRLVGKMDQGAEPCPSLRCFEYGGAPMGADVIRQTSDLFGTDLLATWGMTEFGPGTYLSPQAHRRAFAGERPELLGSCGQAALLSTVAVLDEDGRPVPRDGTTMGEICHRGPNNMLSYFNRPEETADLMRDGWVHSGDAAVWDFEGFFYIVDRIKSMIISGGENIFPSEIERTLTNHPAVLEAAVVGVPDAQWGEVVKAYVVRSPRAELSADDVRDYVEVHLAGYKKPRLVEFVAELPMTPTGKVDRKVLREGQPLSQPTALR